MSTYQQKRLIKISLLLVVLTAIIGMHATVNGQSASIDVVHVTVEWMNPTTNADGTPLTDLAFNKVCWANSRGGEPLSCVETDAPVESLRIPGFVPGTTVFMVVHAVDTSGNISKPSNELMVMIPTKVPGDTVMPSPATGECVVRLEMIAPDGEMVFDGHFSCK